ncbi:MAG: outer membrane beta-barrel protein, partial [Bacteroidota bacterium]
MNRKFYPLQIAFVLLTCLFHLSLFAQKPEIVIRGKVIENSSDKAVEFATVLIADKETEQTIAGTTTDLEGSFELKTQARNFYIEISFIGLSTQRIEDFSMDKGQINLGTISLKEDGETLDEVLVRAEKSQTEFKLDKRVFNVGKDLSSTGASALDILNNVPSVNVNIEGEVSLRGSNGVQILINGKPSVIASEQGNALGTITADMIEKIEVITNPSAKYEAEGTAGIINIVIKKEERKGVNGSATINTGIPHNHSFGLSMNRRTEKFNLFSQFGVGYRELPNDVESINQDLVNNTMISSFGDEFRNENFYNIILGTDYHINKLNILTLSGNFAYEIEDQPSSTTFEFIDSTGATAARWLRQETTEATNPKWQYELQYKKGFEDDKDHMLLFSALGNFFGKDQSSDFETTILSGNIDQNDQQTRTNFKEAKYTFNADYTKPFNDQWTLETGAQYVLQIVSNDFEVSNSINGEWIPDFDMTNLFEYDQKVLGVYGTGA